MSVYWSKETYGVSTCRLGVGVGPDDPLDRDPRVDFDWQQQMKINTKIPHITQQPPIITKPFDMALIWFGPSHVRLTFISWVFE